MDAQEANFTYILVNIRVQMQWPMKQTFLLLAGDIFKGSDNKRQM